jgi:spore coat polysaccharide biosynthesis protein SpsF
MKVIAIIQARMGSTRLPGKVLMDLGGITVLAHVLRRTCRATLIQGAMVATTESVADDAIVRECHRFDVPCFRGSEEDVLDRYYQAAHTCNAEAVVRVTSDCPLIDRELIDKTIRIFLDQRADYASNISPRTYPRGLDTEVFSMPALERAWREAREPSQREHVTPYLYVHPELFRQASTSGHPDYSQYRWTLDTREDLSLLRAIYARFGNQDGFTWREVIALMEDEPELRELNAHVAQKSLNS